jgi:hypothetical protein
MGVLLMRWTLVVSKGECSDDDEKDVRQQQNPGALGLILPLVGVRKYQKMIIDFIGMNLIV